MALIASSPPKRARRGIPRFFLALVAVAALAFTPACSSGTGSSSDSGSDGVDFNSGDAPGSWDDSEDVVSAEEFNEAVCDISGNAGRDC